MTQSICSSVSSPPSRLVRMTSTASTGFAHGVRSVAELLGCSGITGSRGRPRSGEAAMTGAGGRAWVERITSPRRRDPLSHDRRMPQWPCVHRARRGVTLQARSASRSSGPKRVGQHLGHGQRCPRGGRPGSIRAAVLPQQLAAAAAGHQRRRRAGRRTTKATAGRRRWRAARRPGRTRRTARRRTPRSRRCSPRRPGRRRPARRRPPGSRE